MKNILLLLSLLLSFTVKSQKTYVPDDNFELALISIGADSGPLDDSVLTSSVDTLKKISSSFISDLTGIKDFTALDTLILYNSFDTLKNVDLSNNTSLKYLKFRNTFLDSLDLTNNISLEYLELNNTKLKGINLTSNLLLRYLNIENNKIDSLNITNNILLEYLNCSNDSLTNLDISNNSVLIELYCAGNNLNTLDVSNNDSISKLYCERNNLNSILGLSNLSKLAYFKCSENQLTSLDLSNNPLVRYFSCLGNLLTTIDIANGNNTRISNVSFDARINPALTCVKVDNVAYSQRWFYKDTQTFYALNCQAPSGPQTYIPDDNFELIFMARGLDNGPLDDSVLTSAIDTITHLNIRLSAINSLEGIEDFVSLEYLNCSQNSLDSLDVSQNLALTHLNCAWQQLQYLDISNNVLLDTLNCKWNQIGNLDLSNKINLEYLDCEGNLLDTLDVTNNTLLSYLNFTNNQIDGFIDLSSHLNLEFLTGDINLVDSINIVNSPLLTYLEIQNNQLTELDVTGNPLLTLIKCGDNKIVDLDVSSNFHLRSMTCHRNNLTSLNLNNGNNNFTYFLGYSNPLLSCIQVNDTGYAKSNWTNGGINTALYNLDCGFVRRNITDTTSCSNYQTLGGVVFSTDTLVFLDTIVNTIGMDSIINVLDFKKDTIRDTLSQVSFLSYVSPSGLVITSDTVGLLDTVIMSNGCITCYNIDVTIKNCRAKYVKTQPAPGQVTLVDSTIGNNLKYKWYFGDGDSSSTMLPTHNYAAAGTYNVCLSITDTVSLCTDIFCDSISVDSLGVLRNSWTLKVIRNSVSVNEISELDKISVYPNPNNGTFLLDLGKEIMISNLSIVDINGRLVKELKPTKSKKQEINFMANSGIYFLKIITEKEQKNIKIIVY